MSIVTQSILFLAFVLGAIQDHLCPAFFQNQVLAKPYRHCSCDGTVELGYFKVS